MYRLTLRPDSNSRHQSMWFYFRVRGVKSATFIVSPFKKSSSLYNEGMKICIKEHSRDWERGGHDIYYGVEGDHYILKFGLEFSSPSYWTYISYCFPYSYDHLNSYLTNPEVKEDTIFKKEVFAQSLLKRDLYLLTFRERQLKPIILVTARVHSGETVSSYIMKGLLDSLFQRN